MPFGLCNAPSSFQVTMNTTFGPYLGKFVIIFFDDILIYSKSFSKHLDHLKLAFQTLRDHSFFLKLSKCSLATQQVKYLGHIISKCGVELVPAKVEVVLQWSIPQSIRDLRGFLGLSGFYRHFIQDYATLAAPLMDLLTKDSFQWSSTDDQAFIRLKEALCKAPILGLPDFSLPFVVETDASGISMGVILSQQHHPIAYFSKPFCPKLLHTSTYVHELAAITTTVKKWR